MYKKKKKKQKAFNSLCIKWGSPPAADQWPSRFS